ncbi:MAG: FAD-dependent thymidylate synthase [Anaerolineaceae bacterium]|nr:FAD-dependent thymidylate synthase [Anaerolineaceae bacterium]
MPPDRKVYLLDPQKLDPETIAVTFAKTSRSPQSFHEIALELTAEKSADFHEKWVVGYGHASVAEHAVLHIAVENISRLAVECLESNRLASYTEKSSRYQKWDSNSFFIPPELENNPPLRNHYIDTCAYLNNAYQEALSILRETTASVNPIQPGENDAAWERRLRSLFVDVARFYLPAASLANVGVTINARALEHALRKMLSHPLQEVRDAAYEIKQAAYTAVPTLIKYVDAVPYLQRTQSSLTGETARFTRAKKEVDWCTLVHYDPQAEERVLAAALYRFGGDSYTHTLEQVLALPSREKERLAALLFENLNIYDIPLRELEYSNFTFDLTLDQGAYFELKRHRMMTQTPQPLTTHLGYASPAMLAHAGLQDHFDSAMQTACQAFKELEQISPHLAAYLVPNAFNRRVLISTNLRSARHLIQLRTTPQAHFSICRATARMAQQIIQASPLFGQLLFAKELPDWQEIEQQFFTRTA